MATIGAPVLDAIGTFLDYGSAATIIMIIWFIVKFFFLNDGGKDETNRAEKFGEWWDEFRAKGKLKREEEEQNRETAEVAAQGMKVKKQRQRLVKPVEGWMLHARSDCINLSLQLVRGKKPSANREEAVKGAKHCLAKLQENLKLAVHHLRENLRKEKNRQIHDYLGNLYSTIAVLLQQTNELTIPEHSDADWISLANEVDRTVKEINVNSGNIARSLEGFIERAEMEQMAENTTT